MLQTALLWMDLNAQLAVTLSYDGVNIMFTCPSTSFFIRLFCNLLNPSCDTHKPCCCNKMNPFPNQMQGEVSPKNLAL